MFLARSCALMKAAIGLPSTNLVMARHFFPRLEDTFSTLVSALVACRRNWLLLCTAMRSAGVMRSPMLVTQATA